MTDKIWRGKTNPKWYLYMGQQGELVKHEGTIQFDTRQEAIEAFNNQKEYKYAAIFQLLEGFRDGTPMTNIEALTLQPE